MTRKKHRYLKMKSKEEARGLLLALLPSFEKFEEIDVRAAVGRVLAEGLVARRSSPHFAGAAMDGIAVRSAELREAGEAAPVVLAPGAYADIDTGDPVPEGFDAVVMEEGLARRADGSIEVRESASPWDHVRLVGEDVTAGELLIPARTRVTPYAVGGALAAGVTRVKVLAKPRVRIQPTGTEIVPPEREPAPGEIVEFNGAVLAGLLREWGAEPELAAPLPDERELLVRAVQDAARSYDLTLVIAGSSAGREDFVPGIIAEHGELAFHGVMMMPGKPVAAGRVGQGVVVGLPGYPASCYLCAETLVRPCLARMLGQDEEAEHVTARLRRKLPSRVGVAELVRVHLAKLRGAWIAVPGRSGAGLVSSLFASDGILTVPALSEGLPEGTEAPVQLLRPRAAVERNLLVIGSHDPALDVVREELSRAGAPVDLAVSHVGSFGGLASLKRAECHATFLHLLEDDGTYNISYLKRASLPGEHVQIAFVRRHQGLMIARGNPKGIRELADLLRPDVTFINRQAGAGTRVLLDWLLRKDALDAAQVRGYDLEVYTHAAVAASVAAGSVDAGLGIRAMAEAFGLDFLPLAWEDYDLVLPADQLGDPRVVAVLELIRGEALRRRISAMAGYDVSRMGEELGRVTGTGEGRAPAPVVASDPCCG